MTPDLVLTALRDRAPLVHCITNYVAMNIAANVLLAAGASPAMVHAEPEVAEFTGISDALTVNVGTLSPSWVTSMHTAAEAATAAGKPWVLDPVAHFATSYRRDVAAALVAQNPTIIRGNASEILALSGAATAGKGADSGDAVADAEAAATALARAQGCVVAVTGAVDFVTDGSRAARISGGSDLMPRVTAKGCALTGLMGGCAAVAPPLEAAVAALALFAEAGDQAARVAQGPGTFQPAFLDVLWRTTPDALANGAWIKWL